ncbi:MAG: hypothetical protein AB3X46_00680 [Leptothrix ochracea]|uniref:hypothetical protein n=1 Tax=Leptothrix ochracea TaxID=735331 RepID=UPI0034E301F3
MAASALCFLERMPLLTQNREALFLIGIQNQGITDAFDHALLMFVARLLIAARPVVPHRHAHEPAMLRAHAIALFTFGMSHTHQRHDHQTGQDRKLQCVANNLVHGPSFLLLIASVVTMNTSMPPRSFGRNATMLLAGFWAAIRDLTWALIKGRKAKLKRLCLKTQFLEKSFS